MQARENTTQTLKVSEVRQNWSQVLNQVFRGGRRVVVEKSGIPVAAVISAADLDRFNQLEAQREERFKILDRMRDAFKDVAPEEIEREVAKAISEVRAENHRARALRLPGDQGCP